MLGCERRNGLWVMTRLALLGIALCSLWSSCAKPGIRRDLFTVANADSTAFATTREVDPQNMTVGYSYEVLVHIGKSSPGSGGGEGLLLETYKIIPYDIVWAHRDTLAVYVSKTDYFGREWSIKKHRVKGITAVLIPIYRAEAEKRSRLPAGY